MIAPSQLNDTELLVSICTLPQSPLSPCRYSQPIQEVLTAFTRTAVSVAHQGRKCHSEISLRFRRVVDCHPSLLETISSGEHTKKEPEGEDGRTPFQITCASLPHNRRSENGNYWKNSDSPGPDAVMVDFEVLCEIRWESPR